jgi:sigma-54 dependent transcriptional regulator, acetoin dehydrogenase operon transcriptional activator AcoR
MNALAANERWAVSRRLLGPLESVQRDAIAQSLLDYHGSKVKTAESPGVSRATIYRKLRQHEIITPAS